MGVDTLQHRLGRAGRGERRGEGVVFLSDPGQEAEVVAKLASLGTIQVFGGLGQFYQENMAGDGPEAAERQAEQREQLAAVQETLETFRQWQAEQGDEGDVSLETFVQNL